MEAIEDSDQEDSDQENKEADGKNDGSSMRTINNGE